MNTHRFTGRQIRTTAAVTVAALVGTAGLAAPAASSSTSSTSTSTPATLPCRLYRITGDRADLPCRFLEAPWQNDEYATFVAMVSVDVG